jgi:hypothetical protein
VGGWLLELQEMRMRSCRCVEIRFLPRFKKWFVDRLNEYEYSCCVLSYWWVVGAETNENTVSRFKKLLMELGTPKLPGTPVGTDATKCKSSHTLTRRITHHS